MNNNMFFYCAMTIYIPFILFKSENSFFLKSLNKHCIKNFFISNFIFGFNVSVA